MSKLRRKGFWRNLGYRRVVTWEMRNEKPSLKRRDAEMTQNSAERRDFASEKSGNEVRTTLVLVLDIGLPPGNVMSLS